MANGPVPLPSVQAAVMKSAAGAAAQAPPSQAVPMHQQAIAQDLSVMAEQNKGYTQGVNIGNQEAAANRSAQTGRLAEESRQAAILRANDLEMQRLDLAEQKKRAAEQQEADFEREQAIKMDDKEAKQEAEAAEYERRKQSVLGFAARNRDENFLADLDLIVGASGSYEDAVALLENYSAQDIVTSNQPALRSYLRQIYRRAAAGKEPDLDALRKDSAKPGYVAPPSGLTPAQNARITARLRARARASN